MVRVSQSSGEILYFVFINLLPSFFENLPISSWLATCALLKEMHQQNELEVLTVLNVPIKNIFLILFSCGTFFAFFNFFGKELFTHSLARHAESFKQERFKQQQEEKLLNQWFLLEKNKFCHLQFLDIKTKQGAELSIFTVSPSFKIESVTTAKAFTFDQETETITILEGSSLNIESREQKDIFKKDIKLPSFFSQLRHKGKELPLKQFFFLVAYEKSIIPEHVYDQLLYLFLQRFLVHFLLILYPLLTLSLFLFFPHHKYLRWAAIFIPYPLFMVTSTITDSLFQFFHNGLFAIIPYVILLLLIITTHSAARN